VGKDSLKRSVSLSANILIWELVRNEKENLPANRLEIVENGYSAELAARWTSD
jgi:hypothetical protein